MARLLALEWDAHEARIVVGHTGAKGIVLDRALAVDLQPRHERSEDGDSYIGERLAAALSAHGISRAETLVAVGRANIELRLLSVPPAPDDELPEIIRFQALRQFTSIDDDWPLDYCRINIGSEDDSVSVLAAAISPELVAQINQTCKVGGLTPQRLILRPFAAASLLRRRDSRSHCQMMVDLLTDEADLTVLIDREVVFLRTVRVPENDDPQLQTRALLGEIRRTMVAAQNQLGGRRVERLIVCGDDSQHVTLQQQFEKELSLPVELFDPFSQFELSAELSAHHPDNPGRFAPLLGMLSDEASGQKHSIDFLHPRKKSSPPSRLRSISIAAGVLAALVLLVVGVFWWQLRGKDLIIAELTTQSTGLDAIVSAAQQQQADLAEIDRFAAGDVIWLNELSDLSQKFPPAENAMVTQMLLLAQKEGGKIILDGYVTESWTIDLLESGLRDDRHTVSGTGGKEDKARGIYRWQFKETIGVKLPKEKQNTPENVRNSSVKSEPPQNLSQQVAAEKTESSQAEGRQP